MFSWSLNKFYHILLGFKTKQLSKVIINQKKQRLDCELNDFCKDLIEFARLGRREFRRKGISKE